MPTASRVTRNADVHSYYLIRSEGGGPVRIWTDRTLPLAAPVLTVTLNGPQGVGKSRMARFVEKEFLRGRFDGHLRVIEEA